MTEMQMALILTGVGLATVFGALLLFYLSIVLLGKAFPSKEKTQKD